MQYYLLIANLAHKVYVTDSKIHVSIEVGVRGYGPYKWHPIPRGIANIIDQ